MEKYNVYLMLEYLYKDKAMLLMLEEKSNFPISEMDVLELARAKNI